MNEKSLTNNKNAVTIYIKNYCIYRIVLYGPSQTGKTIFNKFQCSCLKKKSFNEVKNLYPVY